MRLCDIINMMNLNLTKQTKIIFISLFTLILLGGVFYGGWGYWQNRKPAPDQQEPSAEEPAEEKAYEIIDNPDESHTFICYKFGFKFDYPEGWEFSERGSNLVGATGSDNVGWAEIVKNGNWRQNFRIYVLLPRDKSKFSTFRGFLVYLRDKSNIPLEPNFVVSGVPAFKYIFLGGRTAESSLEVAFEHSNQTFKIYLPVEKQDDPEYLEILNSFKFIE